VFRDSYFIASSKGVALSSGDHVVNSDGN